MQLNIEFAANMICALLGLFVLMRLLPVKRSAPRYILLYVATYFPMGAMAYIGDPINILFTLPLYMVVVCLLCSGGLLSRFSLGMVLYVLMISAKAFLINIGKPFDRYLPVLQTVLWLGILLFVYKAVPKDPRPEIRAPRLWLLVDALALMPFGSVLAIITLAQYDYPDGSDGAFSSSTVIYNRPVMLVVLALAAVCALTILVAVVILARHETLEHEQRLTGMRQQYYDNLENSQVQVRRLRHDMVNHLVAMSGLNDDGMRAYLDELLDSPALAASGQRYENSIVNAVMASKTLLMEEHQISFEPEITLPAGLPVADMDLCALLANCLDNAIEANLKLPVQRRHISLLATTVPGMMMLRLENAMDGELKCEGGEIVTTKKDKTLHGYGLAGMRDIARRYNGTMEVEQVENRFVMILTLRLDPENQK